LGAARRLFAVAGTRGRKLFQAGARGFGGAVAVGGFAPGPGLGLRDLGGFRPAALIGHLKSAEIAVDLGDGIGSRLWWRGLATLVLLSAMTFWAGSTMTPLTEPVRGTMTPAQADDARPDRIAPLALGAATGRFTAPTAKVRALAEVPERPRVELTATLRASDSFEGALRRAGVGKDDANDAARAVGAAVRLDQIRGATDIDLVLGRRETKKVPRPLDSLAFRAAFELRLELTRAADGTLRLKRIPIAIDETPLTVTGRVGGSLGRSAKAAGLPATVVAEAIQQLGYVVDFQHGVGRGDDFQLIVEHRRAATGETQTGKLIYARLGKNELMRWDYNGASQFFRANGESARKGLMKTPVDGARLTSDFGMRFHPLLNYSRMHQGVDFGVPAGTPIKAAASGKATFVGWHGGHGNYVMLAHSKTLSTAYAHMSRFAVKPGQQVAQGQVIGYVGSTGMSTGPHLHYETWLSGRPVNPVTLKFLGGTSLAGADYGRFKGALARLTNR